MQGCGKVTKFFGVGGVQEWRNGLSFDPGKGCDGNTSALDSLPDPSVSCASAFMVGKQTVSLIGWATLDDWCKSADCVELSSLGERPVVVCHDFSFNAAECCIEQGQHPPGKFRSTIAKCRVTSSSSSTTTLNYHFHRKEVATTRYDFE